MGLIQRIVGPRVPITELGAHRGRYAVPTLLLSVARVLLLISIFVPYWHMELEAPQYPNGLEVTAFVNQLTGDVKEIDGLNHYIGMRPLTDAAVFERTVAIWMIIAMVLLVEGAAYVHSKWAALLAVPAVLFPPIFLLDLYYWLHTFGQNLDPKAPLSSSIKPFTPPVLGTGTIGQFKTHASMGNGLILAMVAGLIVLVALYFHRRAYKPLVEKLG